MLTRKLENQLYQFKDSTAITESMNWDLSVHTYIIHSIFFPFLILHNYKRVLD